MGLSVIFLTAWSNPSVCSWEKPLSKINTESSSNTNPWFAPNPPFTVSSDAFTTPNTSVESSTRFGDSGRCSPFFPADISSYGDLQVRRIKVGRVVIDFVYQHGGEELERTTASTW